MQQADGEWCAAKGDGAGQGRAAAAAARGWWDTWQSHAKRQTHLEIANHGQLRRIRQKHFSATLANDAED